MKTPALEVARFAAVLAVVAVTAAPAGAETVRDACTHDAFRLCSSAIPDVGKTKACLARNSASLSETCQQAFGAAHGGHRRHRRRHR